MQHPGGSPSVVNTSTKINTVECQWLKIKQVKEGFFFFLWRDEAIIDQVAESCVSEGVIFEKRPISVIS